MAVSEWIQYRMDYKPISEPPLESGTYLVCDANGRQIMAIFDAAAGKWWVELGSVYNSGFAKWAAMP